MSKSGIKCKAKLDSRLLCNARGGIPVGNKILHPYQNPWIDPSRSNVMVQLSNMAPAGVYAVAWGNCWPLMWPFNTLLGKFMLQWTPHVGVWMCNSNHMSHHTKTVVACPEVNNSMKNYLSQTIFNCPCAHKHVLQLFRPIGLFFKCYGIMLFWVFWVILSNNSMKNDLSQTIF